MNTESLKYFIEVAKVENFTEAAENLFTTQSVVSKHIIALEKKLNLQLFDRSRRKVQLTDQGRIVLKFAEKILSDYDDMVEELLEYGHYSKTVLSIGSIPVMAQYRIPDVVADFNKHYPSFSINVDEVEGHDLLDALGNREYELAFMRKESLDENKFSTISLRRDFFVAIVSTSHPLADRSEISLRELEGDNFLFLNKGTLLYSYCYELCQKVGFNPHIVHTGTRIENILELVANNMGVSLLMNEHVSYLNKENIKVIPFKETIFSHVALVHSKKMRLSIPALTFWNYIKKFEITPCDVPAD